MIMALRDPHGTRHRFIKIERFQMVYGRNFRIKPFGDSDWYFLKTNDDEIVYKGETFSDVNISGATDMHQYIMDINGTVEPLDVTECIV